VRERQAGIFSADVYVGGLTTPTIELKPRGFLLPLGEALILPEVVDEKNWKYYGLYYDKKRMLVASFSTPQVVAFSNSEQVKPGEIKSMRDLLNPKWKGKIVINDSTTMGSGKDKMEAIRYFMGDDYLKMLVEQKPTVIRDQRQQVEWVARGKFPIGVGLPDSIIAEFVHVGAPITSIIAEVDYVGTGIGGVGLFTQSPHPNVARLFVNWILSKEGQNIFAKLADHASRRLDVTNEWLESYRRPQPGKTYFVIDEEIQLQAEERMEFFKEIFKPVM